MTVLDAIETAYELTIHGSSREEHLRASNLMRKGIAALRAGYSPNTLLSTAIEDAGKIWRVKPIKI